MDRPVPDCYDRSTFRLWGNRSMHGLATSSVARRGSVRPVKIQAIYLRRPPMHRSILLGIAASLVGVVPLAKAQPSPPLPEHKILALEEGVWDAEVTMFLPGQEPAKSKGVETNRMLAGKWSISDFKGEFFGNSFEGHGVRGYDAKKSKYVATWVDTTSARIDEMEGTYDQKTKTLNLNGEVVEPGSGKPAKMRMELQFKDDDTRTLTQFVQMNGQTEFVKLMEIKYTKRKS
jgi:hypothetical protein